MPRIGAGLDPLFGDRPQTDLAGVLKEVKAAGFDGVETGLLCGGNAAVATTALTEHGLTQGSLHTRWTQSYRVDAVIKPRDS